MEILLKLSDSYINSATVFLIHSTFKSKFHMIKYFSSISDVLQQNLAAKGKLSRLKCISIATRKGLVQNTLLKKQPRTG